MSATAFEDRRNVVVAVGFDDQASALVAAGEQICLRTGKSLNIVHVVEPWLEQAMLEPLDQGSKLIDIGRSVDQTVRVQAESLIAGYAQRCHPSVRAQTQVLTGATTECLTQYALEANACLIIVGIGSAKESAARFLPGAFSTALSLMADSILPVLVMPASEDLGFSAKNLRMMLMDDIGERTEPAVELAFDLASALGGTQLKHVHVTGLDQDSLQVAMDRAAATTQTPVEAEVSAAEAFRSILAKLKEKLAARSLGREEYLENSGGTYEIDVRSGKVSEKIEELATSWGADVCIFGKHKTLHRSPYYLGRVPARAMLSLGVPVIVVPPLANVAASS